MIRVYVPTTLVGLARAQKRGTLNDPDSPQLSAHAVTPAVQEWYVEGNLEELEYSALIDAAEASLRLLAADPPAPRRRVVVAVDVAEAVVSPAGGGPYRSSVSIGGPIELSRVVSVHVDEVESTDTIVVAVDALDAAAEGDEDAQFQLDEAEACDLLWYDISEIDDLIG
jgi:hypothetical protein